uniref:LRRN4 C-terminal-like protein n=1 Tax=Doryrhamphus excisus TaxID=161450 RepID=UPI0025AE3D29|nr:LRRN4 C-terminal-like protein [Doryrhamphus excisus]XP_057919371.1 LRRN4 C-terminal-like protein [Doryrhamphus excisus]XP_057919372.1 LRRN4 C-terminal-like protein [Doryrhamphus excisus]XP_057919373.1 LRRN4 C-terminal-like protein [Doryrhamphus excisus]XP_057919374.1 LRRN4 C-terminal-like protein [Doryrhamphus excisus]
MTSPHPTMLLLFLMSWPPLSTSPATDAASTSLPSTRPRITFITGFALDDYDDDYDEDDLASRPPPEVLATTRTHFLQRALCQFNPCLENQVPCAELAASTRCLCPGISGPDTPPHAPRVHALVPIREGSNRGQVEVQWCSPSSVVTQYRVLVEGQGGQVMDFGSAFRRSPVGFLEAGTRVCVEAVNKAGHSEPSQFSCQRYDPPSSDHEVLVAVIGGGIALLLLILAAIFWRCWKSQKAKRDSAEGLGNPSYSKEGSL